MKYILSLFLYPLLNLFRRGVKIPLFYTWIEKGIFVHVSQMIIYYWNCLFYDSFPFRDIHSEISILRYPFNDIHSEISIQRHPIWYTHFNCNLWDGISIKKLHVLDSDSIHLWRSLTQYTCTIHKPTVFFHQFSAIAVEIYHYMLIWIDISHVSVILFAARLSAAVATCN